MEDILNNLNEQKRKLAGFKKMAEDIRTQRIVNETNLKNLERNQAEIIQRCQELGYNPNRLKETLLDKTNELQQLTDKLDRIMPNPDGTFPGDVNQLLASLGVPEPVTPEPAHEPEAEPEEVVTSSGPLTDVTPTPGDMDFSGLATEDFDFGDMMI